MKSVDSENWTTGNYGHEFLFSVISWNLLEAKARWLLAALLDANENTASLFEDFATGHLINALKLAIEKNDDKSVVERCVHFVRAFETLQKSRNTILHGLIGVYPHDDGKDCIGKVLTQRVRGKHEFIEANLAEHHLRSFVLDCGAFSQLLDEILSDLRPDDAGVAFQEALQETGFIDRPKLNGLPKLPQPLELTRYKVVPFNS